MKARRSAVVVLAALLAVPAGAQKKPALKIDVPTMLGFKAPIEGEDGRTVALVTGAKMTPSLTTGEMEITGFRLETFRYAPDRKTELVAESPFGRFGSQGAGSGERMTLESADRSFSISGTGWSWDRGTSMLVISNAVETTLRRGGADTNRPPVSVRAARFEYHLRTGDARFVRECLAEDPGRARVAAGELRSRLSPTQTQPDAIFATNGVAIDLLRGDRPGSARGATAEYHAAATGKDERILLSGATQWRFGSAEGEADRLALLPGQDAYNAEGHARIRLRTPTTADRPPGSGTPSAPDAAHPPLEILCEAVDAKGTNVVLVGPLVARQGDRLEAKAGHLVAALGPDPKTKETRVHFAKATGGVSARVGKGTRAIDLHGEAMTYAWADGAWIDVAGSPRWEGDGHAGSAVTFRIQPDSRAFEADRDVRVRWTAPGQGTNAAPVVLEAARMRGDDSRVAFSGGVKASGDSWRLASAEAEIDLGSERTLRGLVARDEVRFVYGMTPVSPGSHPFSKTWAKLFGDGKEPGALDWNVDAALLRVGFGPSSAAGKRDGGIASIDASGGVDVRHVAVKARGGRLTFAAEDGLLRLTDDAEIRALDGMEVVGLPKTTLTVNPRTGVLGVDGPVRRWVLPASMLRGDRETRAPIPGKP